MDAGRMLSLISSFFRSKGAQLQPFAASDGPLFACAVMHGICSENLGRVQIVSSDDLLRVSLADIFLSQGVDICFSTDIVKLEKSNVLIIDIDSLGGILRVIDQLLVLRLRNTSRITILLSTDFSRDDFEPSRLWVCDASLRLPFSFARLEQALLEADSNNLIWQDRRVYPADIPWVEQMQGDAT